MAADYKRCLHSASTARSASICRQGPGACRVWRRGLVRSPARTEVRSDRPRGPVRSHSAGSDQITGEVRSDRRRGPVRTRRGSRSEAGEVRSRRRGQSDLSQITSEVSVRTRVRSAGLHCSLRYCRDWWPVNRLWMSALQCAALWLLRNHETHPADDLPGPPAAEYPQCSSH